MGHGCDPSGLSGWTWAQFKGKAECLVITVSLHIGLAFRTTTDYLQQKKLGTVSKQHTRHYQQKDNILEPDILDLFDRALLDAVNTWLDMGNSVVLGIYMNEDIRTSRLTKGLQELGLYYAVLTLHIPASPPATQNGNQCRKPIDAVFVLQGVVITRAGYCAFNGDHTM